MSPAEPEVVETAQQHADRMPAWWPASKSRAPAVEASGSASYGQMVQPGQLDTRHGAVLYLEDISVSFDEKESLATESDPGDPLRDPDATLEGGPVDGILGTGTTLRAQAEPLILSGGLGLSFATEVAERTIRFKPSLEWMYQRDELALRFAHIETEGSNPDQCQPCRAT